MLACISLETSEEIPVFQDIGCYEAPNHHQEHENKRERKAALLFDCICGESLYMQSSNHQIYHQTQRLHFPSKHVNNLAFNAERLNEYLLKVSGDVLSQICMKPQTVTQL